MDVSPPVVDVLAPVAVDTAYSYRAPPGLTLAPGDLVRAPLGTRETLGVVWAVGGAPASSNLKTIIGKLDQPPLSSRLRAFVDWVAAWTLAPRGLVLRMTLRGSDHEGRDPLRRALRPTGRAPERLTPARGRALAAAAEGFAFSKAELARRAACSPSVVDALIEEGVLESVPLPPRREPGPSPDFARPALNAMQAAAVEALCERVAAEAFSATLLEGVTGSGKTEVCFEAVAAALSQGRQSLILMPEIALTGQFLARFTARFGAQPGEWHSGVPSGRRARLWRDVAEGAAPVVVGARSALFLPFRALGLVVVDEEHEAAYKQEDGVPYHARDMAVVRARLETCPVVLASATPSLETRANVERGRYGRLLLPGRFGARDLPAVSAVDLRAKRPERGRFLSPTVVSAAAAALQRGEQALFFLNRRGYAPLTLCRACGHRFQCPNCAAWLVEHRFRRSLMCHHCGHVERRPEFCPSCEEPDSLIACGPGVERLADEVAELFPDARRLTLSSDFPGGTQRLREEIAAVADHQFDIVIGTQLIAKGHNFPGLTLVAVVDADLGLANGDPRAAERTFQVLQQVTGRAGRGERPGRALLQTWQPDHPVIRALLSGDSERFYGEEAQARRRACLPPFGRLAALIVSGPDRIAAESHARAIALASSRLAGGPRWSVAALAGPTAAMDVTLLGPAEAPLAVLRGRHRFRLLARSSREADLQGFLRALLAEAPPARGGVRVAVDVDPYGFT